MLEQTNMMLAPIGDVSALATTMCTKQEEIQKFGKKVLIPKPHEAYAHVLESR
jgi:hypothetical protein